MWAADTVTGVGGGRAAPSCCPPAGREGGFWEPVTAVLWPWGPRVSLGVLPTPCLWGGVSLGLVGTRRPSLLRRDAPSCLPGPPSVLMWPPQDTEGVVVGGQHAKRQVPLGTLEGPGFGKGGPQPISCTAALEPLPAALPRRRLCCPLPRVSILGAGSSERVFSV